MALMSWLVLKMQKKENDMKSEEKNERTEKRRKMLIDIALSNGLAGDELEKFIDDQLKVWDEISELFVNKTYYGKIKPFPLFNEESCRCLNCGRVLLCGGPCCDHPRYCEETERYKGHLIEPTDDARIFKVSIEKQEYYVLEEKAGVLSNSMWLNYEDALSSIK